MYDLDMVNLGKRLREYRKTNNISIEDLGKAIGKSRATINRYENRRNLNGYFNSIRNM